MRRVQILSPFRGATPAERARNVAYAQAALLDCLERDEAPFAPHLFYPAVLDDSDPKQRATGIRAGMEIMIGMDVAVVYGDIGISDGMRDEELFARRCGIRVEFRLLPGWAATTQELPVVTMDEPSGE